MTGRHVREASLRGVGLGVLGGTWDSLGPSSGSAALSPLGTGTGTDALAVLAPTTFKLVRFRARSNAVQATWTRTFRVRVALGSDVAATDLCTIGAGQSSCASNTRVAVPAGARLDLVVASASATPSTRATFGRPCGERGTAVNAESGSVWARDLRDRS
ncbi:MAG TPA: hypothetical protein VK919_01395 [Solirubrobacterales bacterium]|nr:hypothetical protein [Solirubrobacterales bacterium]